METRAEYTSIDQSREGSYGLGRERKRRELGVLERESTKGTRRGGLWQALSSCRICVRERGILRGPLESRAGVLWEDTLAKIRALHHRFMILIECVAWNPLRALNISYLTFVTLVHAHLVLV